MYADSDETFLKEDMYTSPRFRIDRKKAEKMMGIRYENKIKNLILPRALIGPGSLLIEE